MARIFINYRRGDSPGVAGRLFDQLALKFSRRDLFMDVDAMKPGMDFAKQLDAQVAQCQVLLAVIGPRWLDAREQAGQRRLDSDGDYVRVELSSALKRDIPVIPILVDGAAMPSEDGLPDDLKPLARRHAMELRHTRFSADADAIVHALENLLPRRRAPWRLIGVGIACVIAVAAIAAFWPSLSAVLRSPQKPPVVVAAQPEPANSPAPIKQSPVPSAPSAPAPGLAPAPAAPASAETSAPSSLPAGVQLGEVLPNTDMPGSNYQYQVTQGDAAACQAACQKDARCAAWTYTQSTPKGQPARCGLKELIPEAISGSCCTSGVEREPQPSLREPPPVPAGLAGALPGINIFGPTYRRLSGAEVTVTACQQTCKDEQQCRAWTYIRPGVTATEARCILESGIQYRIRSNCCIAGVER